MNSRTNKKRNKNTTQKLWMNAPHNKNKKKRYLSRKNDDVFGDLAVPSLHDVTLKMHNVIDRADNAMLSFKPINYKRIHKRWRNKKYKVVSGGVGDEKLAEVKKGIGKLTGDVDALTGKVAEIEKADTIASPDVASKGDECLDPKGPRTFSGYLQANNTVRISVDEPGTYDAFVEKLAAIEAKIADDDDDGDGAAADDGVDDDGDDGEKEEEEEEEEEEDDDAKTTLATTVDAAAAAAGAAGAAAAAALFSGDHTPATKTPILSGKSLDWSGLKDRWVQVHSTPSSAYKNELRKDAGDPGPPLNVKRHDIFDWLKITDPLDTAFDLADAQNKANSENNDLYTALNDWIAKWNEYGGKIRTITSIKGGEPSKGPPVKIINTGTGTVHNVTKVTFAPGYDLAENEKKAYGLTDPEYGNFYAGFDATDTNARRYEKGNFKDMIGTLAKGGNAAIFGYGYSGSGKTYTLTNYEPGKHDANGIAIKLLGELIDSAKFTIELTISELYCSDFTITSQHAVIFKGTDKALDEYDIDVNKKIKTIGSIDDFIAAINKVKTDRIANHHIKYTLNNPESSRGHLFYKFKITSRSIPATTATLTIVDMGGRENPVELSDSSYMIIKGSPLGQIVDRTSNNEAVYYSKSAGVYQPIPDKQVTINSTCSNVRHITGEHHTAEDWQNKCHSIIASSFGGLFFDNNKYHAFDDGYSYDKLPLRDPNMVSDKKDKQMISVKIKLFLEACKEGLYINETINHLVAYINFLSNISKIKNIPNNIATKDATGKGTLISLDNSEYTYHPERYIINPLGFIKNKAANKLRTLINDEDIFNNKIDENSTDTVGILTQLWDIKKPDEKVPAIICFIACVRNDNFLRKHEIATKATLEFAMSVSASNAPPPKMDDVRPETTYASVVMGPHKALKPESIAKKIIPYVGTGVGDKNIKPWVTEIVAKFKKDTTAKKNDGNAFLKFLQKEIVAKIDTNDLDRAVSNELEGPILLRVLQYLIRRQNESNFLPKFTYEGKQVSLDNVAQYNVGNKSLIKAAKNLGKAGGAGSGAKTRKRESRREKKNRMTRRRNREYR
jgi:hypothetical protein